MKKMNSKKDEIKKEVVEMKKVNKSEVMRKLFKDGKSVSEISKEMNVNYSYVYQVVSKMDGFEKKKDKGERKSDVIRKLWKEGKSVGEISYELRTNYSYVWKVVDDYRRSEEK